MKALNCVIIEDQLPAQRILKGYIEKVPNLTLVGSFIDPTKAFNALQELPVDILFLDIELPKISGINFLKSLKNPPIVILTTAFSEYAVEGFELEVTDYLLKPFPFERFLKAISKVNMAIHVNEAMVNQKDVFVKVKGILQKIELNDILFVESKGDFSIIRTEKEGYIVNLALRDIVSSFGKSFQRCHKSYVINMDNVQKIMGNQIKFSNHTIPIGRVYKEPLLSKIRLI